MSILRMLDLDLPIVVLLLLPNYLSSQQEVTASAHRERLSSQACHPQRPTVSAPPLSSVSVEPVHVAAVLKESVVSVVQFL
jgi:hypothetical protein